MLVSYWPGLASTLTDAREARFWRNELAECGGDEDVVAAVKAYAHDAAPEYPSLPILLRWVKGEASGRIANTPYLPEHQSMSLVEWEERRIAEIKEARERYPDSISEEMMAERIALIRTESPWLRRVNELIAGTETTSTDEWWRATFGNDPVGRPARGPQRVGDIIAGMKHGAEL